MAHIVFFLTVFTFKLHEVWIDPPQIQYTYFYKHRFRLIIFCYQQESSSFPCATKTALRGCRIQLRKLVSWKPKAVMSASPESWLGIDIIFRKMQDQDLDGIPVHSSVPTCLPLHLHKHTPAGDVRGHLREQKMTSFRLWNNQSSLQYFWVWVQLSINSPN